MKQPAKTFSVTTALVALVSALLFTVAVSGPAEAAGNGNCADDHFDCCTVTVKDAPAGASTGVVIAESEYRL